MPSNAQIGTVAANMPTQPKIILVDDRALSRSVAAIMLSQSGFMVDEASSGPDCLDALERTDFDVALIDIQMPGMDGFEVAAKIRRLPGPIRNMAVIAISGNAEAAVQTRALEAGFDDFIEKPFDAKSLITKISKVMGTKETAIVDQQFTA